MDPSILEIAPDVREALETNQPVVALESTIIAHGMPYPQNVETALLLVETIRDLGAVPATCAIFNGVLKAGLSSSEIDFLGQRGKEVPKASRRDFPLIMAEKGNGATTVAGTMIIAEMAEISVLCTGGIGGVHRGAPTSFDVSADLQELAYASVAVICSGAKSVLDIGLTLEYLETHGVPVVGYQTDEFPAFFTSKSGFAVDRNIESPERVAEIMHHKWEAGMGGGIIVANPIPQEHELEALKINTIIEQAIQVAEDEGITGKAVTPFLLSKIEELSGGKSLDANIQLIQNNAKLAANVATEYCKLNTRLDLTTIL